MHCIHALEKFLLRFFHVNNLMMRNVKRGNGAGEKIFSNFHSPSLQKKIVFIRLEKHEIQSMSEKNAKEKPNLNKNHDVALRPLRCMRA